MKLTTKMQLTFLSIIVVVAFQSWATYSGISSIGSELEEIADYQIPVNTLIMEIEKEILTQNTLIYKLLFYSDDTHSQEFSKTQAKLVATQKKANKNFKVALVTINKAISHSHEEEVKNKYQKLKSIFEQLQTLEKNLTALIEKLETDLKNEENSKITLYKKNLDNLLYKMNKEIEQMTSIMQNLLEKSTQRALKDEESLLKTTAIILIFLFIFLSIIGYLLSSNFKKSLTSIELYIQEISQSKDLSRKLNVHTKDEIGAMAQHINSLILLLKDLIGATKNSSTENASISHELSTTSLSVGNKVEESVIIVEEATMQAEEIQKQIINAVEEAHAGREDILQAKERLTDARSEIISLSSKVQITAQAEVELAQNMQTLSSEADEVKNILIIIGDIADQTNLLALNAAIEAARAGGHGRGFAVVADEVRKLAERTQKTLSEINATISVVVQSIGDASTQMSENAQEIQGLADLAQGVEDKINETVEIVNEAVNTSDNTVKEFENTGKNVETIVHKVQEINTISSSNARSVEEIAAAAEHLNSMTNELNSKLEIFRT